MLKRFLRDSLIYGSARVVGGITGLLVLPIYTRVLGSDDFGIIDLLVVMTGVVNLTVALEITQAVGRFYPDAKETAAKREVASTALWFTIGAYLAFVAVAICVAPWAAPWLLGGAERVPVFLAGVASAGSAGVLYFLLNQLRWRLQAKHHAAVSGAQVLVTTSCGVVLVVVLQWGVMGVIVGQIVGNAVATGIAFWWCRDCFGFSLSAKALREMLSYSVPLVPSSVGVIVALYADRVAIKELMTLDDLGRYAIAYRIASIAMLVMASMRGAWTPLVYSRYREISAPEEMARVFRYFSAFSVVVVLGLAAFSPELVWLLATPEYLSVCGLIPLVGAATVLGGMYIFAPGLGIAKKTKAIAGINIVVAIENVLLNVALIPFFGLYGAAGATLLSAATQFALYFLLGQKLYRIPHKGRRLLLGTLVAAGIIVLWRVLEVPQAMPSLESVVLKVGIYAVAVVGVLVLMIGREELRRAGLVVAKLGQRRTGQEK